MPGVTLQFENFENPHPERCLLINAPRLNLRQAFHRMSLSLPDAAGIVFAHNDEGISARIHPHAGEDEPKLSYQFFPEHESVVIRRIHAGEKPRQGLGTSMIASQLPFWRDMSVRYIDLLCSTDDAKVFYEKLGFEAIHMIPEYEWNKQCSLMPMRLDLQNPAQKSKLDRACARAKPLTDPAFCL